MINRISGNGLLLALCGFALLSCGDAVVKTMAGHWPGTAVAALRYTLGALGLGGLLWVKEGAGGFRVPLPKVQLLRGLSVSIATIFFFSAIFVMPLAEATAIQFTSPMLTALLSAFFLHERMKWQGWVAAVIAFIGVIIVMRPNFLVLGPAALLPLAAALGMAGLMIGNRKAAGAGSPLQMQFLIAAIAAPILILAATIGHFSGVKALAVPMPEWSVIVRVAIVACTASISHGLIYMATTRASAAAIAPMVYVQILVALVLGAIIFGDRPDAMALCGAAIIIGAGLFLWQQTRPRVE